VTNRQALDQAVAVARTHGADQVEIQRWSDSQGRLAEFREFVRALQQTDG